MITAYCDTQHSTAIQYNKNVESSHYSYNNKLITNAKIAV